MVDVFSPRSLAEALQIRNMQRVIPYAGGTDLMVRRRNWSGMLPAFDQPVLLLGGIHELKTVQFTDHVLNIGAAATLTTLLEHPAVPTLLKHVVILMSSPAIRNSATLGGNICNASPAADTVPYLYAADATVLLQSQSGSREMPIQAFILGPGRTALAEDELLTAIRIPLADFGHTDYRKVGTRKANALSKLSFIGLASIRSQHITDIRIAFGAVAPTVVRSFEIEASLHNLPTASLPQEVSGIMDRYATLIRPIDDQRSNAVYRKTVALGLLRNFLNQISGAIT